MIKTPTCGELEYRVRELERETAEKNGQKKVLGRQKDTYRFLAENTSEVILVTQEKKAVFVNKTVDSHFGYSKEDLMGRNVFDYIYPDDKPDAIERHLNLIDGKKVKPSNELRIIDKQGNAVWVRSNSEMIDWDGKPAVLSFISNIAKQKQMEETLQKARDQLERLVKERTAELTNANTELRREIEERRKTEEELRRSEEKYRNLIEQANDGIIIIQDARVKFVNQRLAELLGYTCEEMTGTPYIRYIHPELVSESIERNRRRLAGEPIEAIHENILRHKGGADVYVEVNAEAILFEGKISNLVFVRDITARKQFEAALRGKEKELAAKARNLEEINTALTVLLKKREEDKRTLQEQVVSNVKKLVIPYIDKLKQNKFNGSQITNIELLETSLNDIISPFTHKLSMRYLNLTPAEIKVADLVKQGKTTKEIADLLNLSYKTIERHRENIRGKIGIKNRKINLQSHLAFFQ